jgi:hypothetical protein
MAPTTPRFTAVAWPLSRTNQSTRETRPEKQRMSVMMLRTA